MMKLPLALFAALLVAPGCLGLFLDEAPAQSVPVDPTFDQERAWSPDGARIAFLTGKYPSNAVYLMKSDGAGFARLSR